MSLQDLEKAFDKIFTNFNKQEITFDGPKSDNVIKEAEQVLDIKFPNTYKKFLQEYGFGGIGSFLISGIRENSIDKVISTGVVWKNIKNRKELNQPKHLIVLESVGEGTLYCLDTSQMNDEGECPVVAWPLGGYEETPVLEIVAEDFGKFFLDLVEREIEYKKP